MPNGWHLNSKNMIYCAASLPFHLFIQLAIAVERTELPTISKNFEIIVLLSYRPFEKFLEKHTVLLTTVVYFFCAGALSLFRRWSTTCL